MRNTQNIIFHHSDVLIVGGGGAGLRAALAVRTGGVQVSLVSKGKIGKANNTAISHGAVSIATGFRDPRDNPQVHAEDTWQSGRQMGDKSLISRMTETASQEITYLDQLGVPFRRTPDGNYWITQLPGHSYGRTFLTQTGKGTDFTGPLTSAVRKAGVDLIEDVCITSLLSTAAGKTAVLGFNRQMEPICLVAKALVLATGGGGRIFSATNNASGMTADGYALALRAGLHLLDMEMVQFYPTQMTEPGMGKWFVMYEVFVFHAGGILRNKLGEDILAKHSLAGNQLTRDNICRALMIEILDGNSYRGALELDLTSFSDEKFAKYKHLLPPNIPADKRRYKVIPVVHFLTGGVAFNPDASTSLPGLFAAGEVTGGMHGANRLAGNALAEAWAYGRIAGEHAQRYAKAQPKAPDLNPGELAEGLHRLQSAMGKSSAKLIERLTIKARELSWYGAGPVRNAAGLSQALDQLKGIKNALPDLRAENVGELRRLEELINITLVSESIIKSAAVRKESRGAHYRSDYPTEDGKWIGHTNVDLQNGQDVNAVFHPA